MSASYCHYPHSPHSIDMELYEAINMMYKGAWLVCGSKWKDAEIRHEQAWQSGFPIFLPDLTHHKKVADLGILCQLAIVSKEQRGYLSLKPSGMYASRELPLFYANIFLIDSDEKQI